MAITQTTRFSLYRWSSGGDAFTRAQMDTSHANIEANAAMYGQGIFSARPSAGTVGRFYYSTDTTAFYYDDGIAWRDVSSTGTVLLDATQTLTNKTLTTPKIASILTNNGAATLTLPTSTDTLIGRATTDTLTGKTMSGASNTFSAIPQSAITSLGTDLGLKAPLANPTFTGVPAAPTAAVDTNTTQIATTQFVVGQGYLKSASYTASDVLTKIKTVDGAGSGLDADLLDGHDTAYFSVDGHNHSGTYQPLDGDLTTIAGLSDAGVGYLRKNAANTWSLDDLTLATDTTVVHLAGVETITGQKTFTAASTGFSNSGANGVSLVITGNGATTPTKYIRVKAGVLEFLNDAGTTAVMSMTDAGALTLASTISASGLAGSLLSSANPLMNSAVSVGTSAIPSRQDHVHPVDTSRAPAAGSSSITTVGTIASGTWNGGVVAGQYGGTGVANTGKTLTLGGNVTHTGAFSTEFTVTGNTSVTLPTTGTLVNTAVTTLSSLVSVGTITTGVWNAGAVTSSSTITATSTISASGLAGSLLSSTNPVMDGTAGPGVATVPSRQDHVHPTDTSRSPVAGSSSITTVGTITSGTWNAGAVTSSGGGSFTTVAASSTITATSTISASGLAGSLLSSASPQMNGSVAAGTSAIPSRQDHVHPVDTSRAPAVVTVDTKSGPYTLASTDANKVIAMNSASTQGVTIPAGLTAGMTVVVFRQNTGAVTFAASGTTLFYTPGATLRAQYSTATCTHLGSNNWLISGDLIA